MEKFNLHKNNMQSHLTIISLSDTVSTRYLQNSSRLTNDRFLIQLSERLLLFCLPDSRTQLNLKKLYKDQRFLLKMLQFNGLFPIITLSFFSSVFQSVAFFLAPLAVAHQIFYLHSFPNVCLSTCFRLLSTTVLYI